MRDNKFLKIWCLLLLMSLVSCEEDIKNFINKSESSAPGETKKAEGSSFLPSDLKSVSISASQENGEGFVISSIVSQSKGKPTIQDGIISFNINYETFSGNVSDLTLKTDIFSLVSNGFIKQTYSEQGFSLPMDPGIYILTVTVSRKGLAYPPFKAKMVVKCSDSLSEKIFDLNPSKVEITPLPDVFWKEQNRWVYFGRYKHDLTKQVVLPPSGANINQYTYNIDTNGDGTLEIINGIKVNQADFGLDLINRQLTSTHVGYSTFADDKRFVSYEVYDECYNSKAFEVSSGVSGIFNITEKEDLIDAHTKPQMSEVKGDLAKDPSYMVQHDKPFLQQMQEEPNGCNDRSTGGVNYVKKCDTRLNGTLSLIPQLQRAAVSCFVSNNNSMNINAKEIDPTLSEGLNHNMIGQYAVNISLNGLRRSQGSFPFIDPSSAIINNYTFSVPGTDDAIGKDVLTTNNCTVEVLMPIREQMQSPCGPGSIGGSGNYTTVQDVRVAYQCGNVKSTLGKKIAVAGELYCMTGITTSTSDCKYPAPPSPPKNGPFPGPPNSPNPPSGPQPAPPPAKGKE